VRAAIKRAAQPKRTGKPLWSVADRLGHSAAQLPLAHAQRFGELHDGLRLQFEPRDHLAHERVGGQGVSA
jgi:hypothetical protein